MKIQYPIYYPPGFKPTKRRRSNRSGSWDFNEAINRLKEELTRAKVKNAELVLNVKLDPFGIPERTVHAPGTDYYPAAQVIFLFEDRRYILTIDQYFRTADNIYKISQAIKTWRTCDINPGFVHKGEFAS